MKRFITMIMCLVGTEHAYMQNMVIAVPVASLRTMPKDYTIGQEHDEKESKDMFGLSYGIFMASLAPALRDPAQDTQVLFNEHVMCLEDLNDGWLKVELPEQYGYNSSKQCYEHVIGYIKKEQARPINTRQKPNVIVARPWATIIVENSEHLTIPMGTKLRGRQKNQTQYQVDLPDDRHGIVAHTDIYHISFKPEPEETLRSMVTSRAKQLVGGPYCWGGRSPHTQKYNDFAPSCDCSGLTNLSYRASGLEIARNSHPQWLHSTKINKGSDLKPGDLIFFARPTRKDRVHHVLMYLGDNLIIESSISQGIVIQKTEERFGKPVAELSYGDTIKTPSTQGAAQAKYVIYFGSYLQDKNKILYMRNYALGNYDANRWVKDEKTRPK
jgi:cell wall-associated NlpC family hydrolase